MITSMSQGRDSRPGSYLKKEVQPTVVQLGSTLPYLRRDVTSLWVPEPKPTKTRDSKTSSQRCRKYRNLFEYDILHKNKVDLKKDMWKIPAVSTNILPTKKQRVYKPEVGLYEPKFQKWYARLVHENTVILPPIDTSRSESQDSLDSSRLLEKNYIADQLYPSGPIEQFERDEIHLPDVYSQCYTCAECRRAYVRDAYTKKYVTRNNSIPACSSRKESHMRTLAKQHCDVLGERYCTSCIEERDKKFSKKIEGCMLNGKDPRKIHYEKSGL